MKLIYVSEGAESRETIEYPLIKVHSLNTVIKNGFFNRDSKIEQYSARHFAYFSECP